MCQVHHEERKMKTATNLEDAKELLEVCEHDCCPEKMWDAKHNIGMFATWLPR